jgi:bacillolysin
MNAVTGEIIDKYNHTCTLDSVFTSLSRDLNGVNGSFNIFQSGNQYVMVDPTKPMFNASQFNLPDSLLSVIWTIDALISSIDGDMKFIM